MRVEVQGDVSQEVVDLVEAAIASLDRFWTAQLMSKFKNTYYPPRVVLYKGGVNTACGQGLVTHGPFYCSSDRSVYIDPRWFKTLEEEYEAKVGVMVMCYILAHEVSHAVQEMRGTFHRILSAPGGDSMRVRGELQADYWAGAWISYAKTDELFPWDVSERDIDECLFAATRVGDDIVQMRKRGEINESTYGHGAASQRSLWLFEGIKDKDPFIKDVFEVVDINLKG